MKPSFKAKITLKLLGVTKKAISKYQRFLVTEKKLE